MTDYELKAKIDKILDDGTEYVPYEGYEIDKEGIKNSFIDFLKTLTISDLLKIHES